MLTRDYLQCFKKGSSRISEMGGFIFKIRLAEVSRVAFMYNTVISFARSCTVMRGRCCCESVTEGISHKLSHYDSSLWRRWTEKMGHAHALFRIAMLRPRARAGGRAHAGRCQLSTRTATPTPLQDDLHDGCAKCYSVAQV